MDEVSRQFLLNAFDSNWVAPLGPHVEAFEEEVAAYVGARYAVAVSSGTAGLHLALACVPVVPGDEVLVSTLTFAASAFPVAYLGARPVFVDSEATSWNIDPDIVVDELRQRARRGRLPAALIVTHLYGQTAAMRTIVDACAQYEVPLIEDAAEALGALYDGRPAGTLGWAGVFSFNGNKVITTSGGGMVVTDDADLASRIRKLASQAREPALHYEHREIGYNYRLSNLLAAVGRGQLRALDARVASRRRIFEQYFDRLGAAPGVSFMPEATWGFHTRWLTTLTIDPASGVERNDLCDALEQRNIEARPVWKPMHQQPVFGDAPYLGGTVADELFRTGLCLPSSSCLSDEEVGRVCAAVLDCLES